MVSSPPSDGFTIKIPGMIQPYMYQPQYEMLQNNETNLGGPELPAGSVTVPEPPGPRVVGTTLGTGVIIVPNLYSVNNKPKNRKEKGRRKWKKEEYEIALECRMEAEADCKPGGLGKKTSEFWKQLGMWEIEEKLLMNQIRATHNEEMIVRYRD